MPLDRRRPRYSTRMLVRYHVWTSQGGQLELGELSAARAADLGANGLFLDGVQLPAGTRLHFFLSLPDGSGCVEGFGRVMHATRSGVGIRLQRMSARDRARLDGYLDERRAIEAAWLTGEDVRRRAEARLGLQPN